MIDLQTKKKIELHAKTSYQKLEREEIAGLHKNITAPFLN